MTIDEFEFLLHYAAMLNFDALIVQMLHLVMGSIQYRIESVTNFGSDNFAIDGGSTEKEGVTWRKPPEVSTLPKLE